MVFYEILWDSLTFPNLSSPSIHFPTHLSPLSHILSLLSHHLLCLPHASLTLFSQNSVLYAGNNVETTQLYIHVRQHVTSQGIRYVYA